MEEEHHPIKSYKKAMHEIAGAIIAITFLMAAIPVAFMSGPVEFFIDNLQLRWQLQSFFQGSWH
jgi:multidrug efflux pump subunit AcrB